MKPIPSLPSLAPLLSLASLLSLSALQPFSSSALSAPPPFRDPSLPFDQRVTDLLSRLTTEEKISQLMMASPAIPRLDIPAYDWWNEALHGVARNGIATVFPQAIALAATWNPGLHYRLADCISTEARAKNNELLRTSKTGDTARFQGLTIWSPNINIFRDPRWGRGQETYGEDPYLTARFAVAFVQGLQGDDPRYLKTVATLKHYAVHSGPEPLRHKFSATVSERDFRETYLAAFETGVREGGATSIMSAYNAINGTPASADLQLLTDIPRAEWGFTGAIVGDVDSVGDIWKPTSHAYAKDAAEASALAIRAGNDLCSGGTYKALPAALKRNLLTEADLNTALRRLLLLRFRLGQFDPPERNPYRSIPITENASPEHDALALEAARQSLVLLKNDGTLPLDPKKLANKTIAILGPTGFDPAPIVGNYNGTPARYITLADSLKTRLEAVGARVIAEPAVPLVKNYRVAGDPIPDGVLYTDPTCKTPGFKTEIFFNPTQDPKNPTLVGKHIATETTTKINLHWDESQPTGKIPVTGASIRWTGYLAPKLTGDYTLSIVADGAVRVYIDNRRIIGYWRAGNNARPLNAPLTLEAGKTYPIRIEYAQLTPKASVQLGWLAPGAADTNLARALDAARTADHIILTLGLTPDLEGEETPFKADGFLDGDRLTIQLPETQRALLDQIAALHKPTTLILTGGSALAFDDTKVNAALMAWYYGQRGADAVADVLLGDYNPAGRLPITFYKDDTQLPPFEDYNIITSNPGRTYKYFKGTPLYAFGHGLSYTTFTYTNFGVYKWFLDDLIGISISIKNTGSRDGDEVVQIYATAQNPPVPMPLRQLVAFKRITLKAGETKNLQIPILVSQFRRWDPDKKRFVIDPLTWQFAAGPSSDNLPCQASLQIKGSDNANNPYGLTGAIHENVGIPITMPAFKEKVARILTLVKNGETPSVPDYIEIARIYNTVTTMQLDAKEYLFTRYMDAVPPQYIARVVAKALEAGVSKGLGYHSNKYDISIGGSLPEDMYQNSQYKITGVTK